jgi:hypothetical protein
MLTHVDDIGLLCDILTQGYDWKLFRGWTYGPLATPLTMLGVLGLKDPAWLVFSVRLGELAAWAVGVTLSVALLWRPACRQVPGFNAGVAVLLLALALWSRRAVLDTSQGYGYGLGYLAAVLVLALAVSERAQAWILEARPAAALARGALLGALVLFSYQVVYLLAALWLLWLPAGLRRGQRGAYLLGAAASLWYFGLGYVFHLRATHVGLRHPAWADGYPPLGAGPWELLVFFVSRWHEVWQNLLSFLPWGPGSAWLGTLGLGLAVLPYAVPAGPLPSYSRRLGAYALILGLLWSLTCLAGRAPLAATRHTFILQPLVLLLVGQGLARLRLGREFGLLAALAISLLALADWPSFVGSNVNRVDLGLLRARLEADPGLAVAGDDKDCTWDALLLWRERPDWRPRLRRWTRDWFENPQGSSALLVISHRGPIRPEVHRRAAAAGLSQAVAWAAVSPTGATEWKGNINGGNGFYAVEFRRPAEMHP